MYAVCHCFACFRVLSPFAILPICTFSYKFVAIIAHSWIIIWPTVDILFGMLITVFENLLAIKPISLSAI